MGAGVGIERPATEKAVPEAKNEPKSAQILDKAVFSKVVSPGFGTAADLT